MKYIVRIFILIIISALIVYFLSKHQLLDLSMLSKAFQENIGLVVIVACFQILNVIFMTLRYNSLLNTFKIKASFLKVLGANFMGHAVGQWMPGSLAFIELIRFGLMFGSTHHYDKNSKKEAELQIQENLSNLSFKSKLAVISLFDRVIGFFVMLCMGSIITFIFLINSTHISGSLIHNRVFILLAFSFSLCLGIVALVFISNTIIFRRIFEKIERKTLIIFRHGFFHKFFKKLFHEMTSLFDAIALGMKQKSHFWKPMFYSLICCFLTSLGTYFAAKALSGSIPFAALLGTISIIAIMSLIPMGFAGIGGPQAIAVIALSVFEVEPRLASSAQFLQTAVNLVVISIIGVFFLKISIKQVRSIYLNSRKSAVTT